ncbi:MAG TPA: hypothetical protein VF590_02230, partial [Isosphaeraceae bacterium]
GLFNGVTALLFGLGVHAERRWRLPTTALGLLVIATLLTPLNFLAVASLGRGTGGGPIWAVAGELVTIGLFAALVSRAGRTLVARSPTALALGVLAPSVAMFAIRRYVHPGAGSAALLSLGAVPWLAQGVAVGGVLFRERRVAEIPEALAHELLRLLGLTAFAAALALGLLLAQGGPIGPALHRLSPLVPLAAAPALVAGLWLWRKTTDPDRAGDRTAGTSIAALATLVLLAGVALAWPDPAGMLPVAMLNFAVLTAVALAFEVPAAHVLAGACLAVAYLLGVLVATGRLGWAGATPDEAARALASARGGTALVPLVLLYGGAAAEGLRRGRRLDAQALAVVTVLAAVLSLGLVTWHGFGRPGDPVGATWVYAVLAAAALAGAIRFGRDPLMAGAGAATTRTLGWTGLGLILAALVQGLVFGRLAPAATRPDLALMSTVTPEMVFGPLDWGAARAWVLALLVHATLTTAGVMVLSRLRRDAIPSDPEFEPEPGRRSPPPPQPSPTKGEGAGSVHSTPTGEAGTIAPSHFRGGGAPTKGATDSWATPEIVLRDILRQSSLATSIATGASVAVVAVAAGATAATLAMDLLWLALVWLALAWRDVAPRLFAAAQAALTGSVVAAVTALLQGRGWYASAPLGWLDPWSVQAHALALGGLALGWIGVRVGVRARRIGRSGSPGDAAAIAVTLLEPPWPAFDRWLRGAVVLALVALAVYGVLPGAAREWTPRDLAVRLGGAATAGTTRVVPPAAAFEIDGVPHGHALGVGSWAVLVVALAVLLAGQWERFRRVDLLGALLAATMAAPLLAGRWESDMAAASA